MEQFVNRWAAEKKVELSNEHIKDGYSELLRELSEFGIRTLGELNEIVPHNFQDHLRSETTYTTYGLVRQWMIISNIDKFLKDVRINWKMISSHLYMLRPYLSDSQIDRLMKRCGVWVGKDREKTKGSSSRA